MVTAVIAIVYLAFISLGLPDSLLGSAWPIMQGDLGVPLSYAGILSIIMQGSTILSSLFADRVTTKFGTGLVTACSAALTAVALMGFSFAKAFWVLCLLAIPYGLGAGAVDASLNSYVALHYSSRHMSWLHGFWGVGVTISPYIMSYCLLQNLGWEMGYRSVSLLQMALTAVLFLTLPMWKRVGKTDEKKEIPQARIVTLREALGLRGFPQIILAFICYCALEATAGLWASTYMVESRGVAPETAARFVALYYLGLTAGRFLSGLISDKVGDKGMVRLGALGILLGVGMIFLPLPTNRVAPAGLVVMGFGSAPVYPCIIHTTP